MTEEDLLVWEARTCVTAYDVLPDIIREYNWAPVYGHMDAEGLSR